MATIWPHGGSHKIARAVVLLGFGAVLLTISAKIKVPFHPVPMTLQTLAIGTISAALGSRLAIGTILTYLAAGLVGLPVFTNTPPAIPGLLYMIGPTGGYLAGFVLSAAIVGGLAERGWDRSLPKLFLAMLLGDLAILSLGVAWLSAGPLSMGIAKALAVGFYPFVLSALVKEALGAAIIRGSWSTLQHL
jgi:biotin transport system substrate-specific component